MTYTTYDRIYAVVGDVVESRRHSDQIALMQTLRAALHSVNTAVRSIQPMSVTVGDEFQGSYLSLQAAVHATLLIQLHTGAETEVRFGIGFGDMSVDTDEQPYAQSGTAWWRAREALDAAAEGAKRNQQPRNRRTVVRGVDADWEAMVNAFLILRDDLTLKMDAKDQAIALGLLRGRTQKDIAEDLEIPPSSVARRAASNGPTAVWRAAELAWLGEVDR